MTIKVLILTVALLIGSDYCDIDASRHLCILGIPLSRFRKKMSPNAVESFSDVAPHKMANNGPLRQSLPVWRGQRERLCTAKTLDRARARPSDCVCATKSADR